MRTQRYIWKSTCTNSTTGTCTCTCNKYKYLYEYWNNSKRRTSTCTVRGMIKGIKFVLFYRQVPEKWLNHEQNVRGTKYEI